MGKKKILILYNKNAINIKCIHQSLNSFRKFSENNVYYENVSKIIDGCYFDMKIFDVVIVHYSVCYGICIADEYIDELSKYNGVKVVMIQDDYHETESLRRFIDRIRPQFVYTVVPEEYINQVYCKERFADVKFINYLTGYIDLEEYSTLKVLPIKERLIDIGYRGRNLGYWFGTLGREKLEIGIYMKRMCQKYDLLCDIEWEEEKRIYQNWFEFLSSCKLTLGTESGSNIFDDYGLIMRKVQKELQSNPTITYEEIYSKFLYKYEGKIQMNQISPKIFEAICCKTGLILYRGKYSNILKAYENYIPLEKDHSNIEEVIELSKNDNFIQNMVENTYKDIALSEKYSYKNFIKQFEKEILSIYN